MLGLDLEAKKTSTDKVIGSMNNKSFHISLELGHTDIDPPDAEPDDVEKLLEEKLAHVTSRFEGYGRVHVRVIEYGRIAVAVSFAVRGLSPLDVLQRFKSDFEMLEPLSRGISVTETTPFKLRFFTIEGEFLSAFIRVNPETGKPMGSSE